MKLCPTSCVVCALLLEHHAVVHDHHTRIHVHIAQCPTTLHTMIHFGCTCAKSESYSCQSPHPQVYWLGGVYARAMRGVDAKRGICLRHLRCTRAMETMKELDRNVQTDVHTHASTMCTACFNQQLAMYCTQEMEDATASTNHTSDVLQAVIVTQHTSLTVRHAYSW